MPRPTVLINASMSPATARCYGCGTAWTKHGGRCRASRCERDVDRSATSKSIIWSRTLSGKKKVKALPPNDADEEHELMQAINALGNCSLLEKTFNISKSDRSLADFISEVHEFKNGSVAADDWRTALTIPPEAFDPAKPTVAEIRDVVDKRDEQMRSELVKFVQGQLERQDLMLADDGEDN